MYGMYGYKSPINGNIRNQADLSENETTRYGADVSAIGQNRPKSNETALIRTHVYEIKQSRPKMFEIECNRTNIG